MRFQRVIPFLCLIGCGLGANNEDPVAPPVAPATTTAPGTVTVPAGGDDTGVVVVEEVPGCATIPDAAREVMEDRCSACHGVGSPEFGGFNDATSVSGLIADGWVIPEDSANSRIFIRIDEGTMPTIDGGGELVAEEKAIIKQWVDCGAEDWGAVGDSARGFIAPEIEWQAARNDVNSLPINDDNINQANARYLSLVPLYNAGVPSDRIELYKTALTKLMWNLSPEDNTPVLEPVDLEGVTLRDGTVVRIADNLGKSLLFRVDLQEFLWDNDGEIVDEWEEMVKLYPFAIQYEDEFDAAEELVQITKTRIPIVHGDWFAANASLPPLYFDVLDMPQTFDEWLLQFGGIADFQAQFDDNQVDCAGMDGNQTLVSNFNRVICRMDSVNGYCWTSFDFAGVADQQNIFGFPDQFLNNEDGGEAFCSMDNGQQSYFVFNAAGQRLDNAPINVVSDYNPDSGGEVKTGLHCMRCHELGTIERLDQVLPAVLANESNFDDAVVDQVIEWYPTNDDWTNIYADDIAAFQRSVDEIGVPIGEEVTWALSEDYEAALDSARVAAVLGIPEGELAGRLASNGAVEVNYQSLDTPDGRLSRDLFETVARDTICDLQLGDVCDEANFCGLSAVPCPAGSVCDALGQCSKLE